jgi:hypothetical protein
MNIKLVKALVYAAETCGPFPPEELRGEIIRIAQIYNGKRASFQAVQAVLRMTVEEAIGIKEPPMQQNTGVCSVCTEISEVWDGGWTNVLDLPAVIAHHRSLDARSPRAAPSVRRPRPRRSQILRGGSMSTDTDTDTIHAMGRLWARRHHDGLYETAEDIPARLPALRGLLPFCLDDAHTVVAGGEVLRALLDDPRSDVDIFFESAAFVPDAASALYEEAWTRPDEEDAPASGVLTDDSDDAGRWLGKGLIVDLIPTAMSLAQRLEGFDFTVCQVAYDGDCLVASAQALEDIPVRTLRVTRETRPGRVLRYLDRGFLPLDLAIIERLRSGGNVSGWTNAALTKAQALGREIRGRARRGAAGGPIQVLVPEVPVPAVQPVPALVPAVLVPEVPVPAVLVPEVPVPAVQPVPVPAEVALQERSRAPG